MKNMNLVVTLLIWTTLIATISCEEETEEEKLERIVSELKLTDWDLTDYYEGISSKRKDVLLHKQPYTDEIKLIEDYGQYLSEQSINLHKIPEDDIPYEHTRNYSLLLKPGDTLLNQTEYHKLVIFAKESAHLSRTLRITHPDDADKKIGQQTYLDFLATSRNTSKLSQIWSNWQDGISNHSEQYGDILNLVTEAASKNELYDAKTYWQMLTEYEDGYQKAETLWNDIEPTYRRLHACVLNRINNYYGTNYTDIPVYLTGSNFGEDWSNLAELIVPHQQMYKDAKFSFEVKTIQHIYKLAERSGSQMGFANFTKKFWSKNNFEDEICAPTLLVYPSTKFSEILTCKNITWTNYLNAHEAVIEAGLKNLDFGGLPRRELRYSFYEEAIVNLGTIIAIQNLPYYGLTPESDYMNFENATENGLAAKLLIALRVLPKLAYYIAADVWRLEELQNPTDNIKQTWWNIRKKYQGVDSVNSEESDFLGDSYITANKPYLSKFFGTLLQFELLNYHQLVPFSNDENLAERLGEESDYRSAIRDIPLKSPGEVLSYNYGFSEVTSQHLLDFFQPLEAYLEQAPVVPYSTLVRERKIETAIPPEDTTIKLKTTATKGNTTITSTSQEIPPVQNDQVLSEDVTENSEADKPATSNTIHSAGMYVLITIAACFFILISVVVFKKLVKMKRPRTNNRRFEA